MTSALKNATIVIVEDDPNLSLVTTELLKLYGATRVHAFHNSHNTVKFVQETEETIDLFLLDIHMPDETGYDLIKKLRNLPAVTEAKIVALTAGVLLSDIRRARSAGFDAFLGKPIKPYDFADQLERILAGESFWEWL